MGMVHGLDIAHSQQFLFNRIHIEILGDRLEKQIYRTLQVAEHVPEYIESDQDRKDRVEDMDIPKKQHDADDQDGHPPQYILQKMPGCHLGVQRPASPQAQHGQPVDGNAYHSEDHHPPALVCSGLISLGMALTAQTARLPAG
jgi:hypothetical protein